MRVTLIAGSNRKQASTTQLVQYIATILRDKGHEATVIDLAEVQLPLYCPDGNGDDANVAKLKDAASAGELIVLATPEYHGSMSGVLKNALDFLGFEHFDNKVVLLASSAGGAVGLHSLTHMQTVIRNLHGICCPEWISLGGDARQFTESGEPAQANVIQRVTKTVDYFLTLAERTRNI
ncbi:NADPH-dependent FMN reductase [Paenibacillus sp. 481]|uniref:NADPH-dependent FMN reductase n=1 Tax=Paenibacillus sp. 481 TaxID=2835869 RepID=UPI001E4F1A57|nr:NADPH-dependent FMN reductase [Paenibacillus sp. 481]UHA72597.1 NAD(P)H-dependent oxidoreductase [Paenibacillus sp. 481]